MLSILLALRAMVLDIIPVTIYGTQSVVADILDLGDLIVVQTCLPIPITTIHRAIGLLVEGHSPATLWEWRILLLRLGIPLNRCTHHQRIGLLWSLALACLGLALAAHAVVGTCQITYITITRTIGEERSLELILLTCSDISTYDCSDLATRLLHANNTYTQEQRNILLGEQKVELLLILIVRLRASIVLNLLWILLQNLQDLTATLGVRVLLRFMLCPVTYATQLIHKITKILIRLLHDKTRKTYSDL